MVRSYKKKRPAQPEIPRRVLKNAVKNYQQEASAFNRANVEEFFNNYALVQAACNFSPDRIWNTDETGITTVLQAPRVIAETGSKAVGQCVSDERGSLVRMCGIISAVGASIPPLYIFPHVRMRDQFLYGAVPGAVGYAEKSGWMLVPETLPENRERENQEFTPVLLRIEELEKAKLMNVKKTNSSRKLVSESKPKKMQRSKQSKRRKKNKAGSDDISSSDSDNNLPFIATRKIQNDLSDSDNGFRLWC
ncbi:hypothetical protein JTB14_002969 [Gonioctena quinquepunctata]|nr:hypothetical protein JTB14_002969 [Gonioctena quinquepunctata]